MTSSPAELACALRVLARTEGELGDHAKAERHYREAVAVMNSVREDRATERERIRGQAGLANVLRMRGRYGEAEALYRATAHRAEQSLGAQDPELATVLNGWAIVYKYTARFEQAEALYRRALGILENAAGSTDIEAASIYHNLGGLAHARGDYAAADLLARRAVEIRRCALHADHPAVTQSKP